MYVNVPWSDTDTNTHRSDESVRDVTAAQLVGGTNVTVTENDAANTLTISSTDTNTDTWRGIQDNLTSTSTTDSLSAKQGKILQEGKVNNSRVLTDVPADAIFTDNNFSNSLKNKLDGIQEGATKGHSPLKSSILNIF